MKLKTGFPQLDNKESTWCPWQKLSWPCNCLPAVPQAGPGVFKSLLPQPSSSRLCLVEGRFLSVIFKLETLQMPTFADQLGWCPWEGTRAMLSLLWHSSGRKEVFPAFLHSPSSVLERIPDSEGHKGYSVEKTVGS